MTEVRVQVNGRRSAFQSILNVDGADASERTGQDEEMGPRMRWTSDARNSHGTNEFRYLSSLMYESDWDNRHLACTSLVFLWIIQLLTMEVVTFPRGNDQGLQ